MTINEIKNLVSKTKLYTLEPGSEVEISLYVRVDCDEVINGVTYVQKIDKLVSSAIYLGIHNKHNELDSLKNCIESCDEDRDVDCFDINLFIQHPDFSSSGKTEFFAWPDMITEDEVELFFSDRCRNNTSNFIMKIK